MRFLTRLWPWSRIAELELDVEGYRQSLAIAMTAYAEARRELRASQIARSDAAKRGARTKRCIYLDKARELRGEAGRA